MNYLRLGNQSPAGQVVAIFGPNLYTFVLCARRFRGYCWYAKEILFLDHRNLYDTRVSPALTSCTPNIFLLCLDTVLKGATVEVHFAFVHLHQDEQVPHVYKAVMRARRPMMPGFPLHESF